MATFKITGLRELEAAFKALPDRVARKVIRQAIRQALKPVLKAVKANAPVGPTGQTKRAVKIRAGRRKKGSIGMKVTVGKGDFTGDQYYAAMTEFGTKKQEAQHWMETAFDETKDQARDDCLRLVGEGIAREVKKLKG